MGTGGLDHCSVTIARPSWPATRSGGLGARLPMQSVTNGTRSCLRVCLTQVYLSIACHKPRDRGRLSHSSTSRHPGHSPGFEGYCQACRWPIKIEACSWTLWLRRPDFNNCYSNLQESMLRALATEGGAGGTCRISSIHGGGLGCGL